MSLRISDLKLAARSEMERKARYFLKPFCFVFKRWHFDLPRR
jgi:hypothetical protein